MTVCRGGGKNLTNGTVIYTARNFSTRPNPTTTLANPVSYPPPTWLRALDGRWVGGITVRITLIGEGGGREGEGVRGGEEGWVGGSFVKS